MITSETVYPLDLLITWKGDEPTEIALATRGFCLQWHSPPKQTLQIMSEVLRDRQGDFFEVVIGTLFGATLFFVRREGIVSFKATSEGKGADLMRIDLSEETILGLEDALADAMHDQADAAFE